MTMFLLIAIAIMTLIIMLSSIISTIIIVKDKKDFKLVKKVLSIAGIVIAIIAVISVAFGVSNMKSDEKESTTSSEKVALEDAGFNEVNLDQYINLINGTEKSIVLVARPTCSYCELFTPILKQAMEQMDLTINYINTDNFSDDDWTKFNESLDYLNSEEWGTPLVLIVQNGEAIAENNGYVDLETIKSFFKENGFGN